MATCTEISVRIGGFSGMNSGAEKGAIYTVISVRRGAFFRYV